MFAPISPLGGPIANLSVACHAVQLSSPSAERRPSAFSSLSFPNAAIAVGKHVDDGTIEGKEYRLTIAYSTSIYN